MEITGFQKNKQKHARLFEVSAQNRHTFTVTTLYWSKQVIRPTPDSRAVEINSTSQRKEQKSHVTMYKRIRIEVIFVINPLCKSNCKMKGKKWREVKRFIKTYYKIAL